MVRRALDQPGAEHFLPPPGRRSLPQLAKAAAACEGCELYKDATHVVFGEGPRAARIMLVGEQPGDKEDLKGRAFIGPAGRLLDTALAEAGIDRSAVYVTNAVKHFRWEPRGKRRIHKRPGAGHIRACLPWLRAEAEQVRPRVMVLMGAVATQAALGGAYKVTTSRGAVIESEDWTAAIVITAHPSSILRAPDDAARRAQLEAFVADLKVARGVVEANP